MRTVISFLPFALLAFASVTTAQAPENALGELLFKAREAGDLAKVGACFSAKAPGEFQSLIDGSCPPDRFKGFCDMFGSASIKGVEEQDAKTARVAVQLGEREESLTVVKEANGWKVLDF